MKYLETFDEKNWFIDKINKYKFNKKIHDICKQYDIKNYTINTDGSIDVDDDVYLRELPKLPLKFNKVNGWFDCSYNELTTLEGSPIEVNGSFYCHNNELTSFEFSPKIVRGGSDRDSNNIKTFEYFPSYVKEYFNCYDNLIWEVRELFWDTSKIELLNDFDIFRDEDTDEPVIIMDRLNDFLLTIGIDTVEKVEGYKNI